jgi:hypothetical protein
MEGGGKPMPKNKDKGKQKKKQGPSRKSGNKTLAIIAIVAVIAIAAAAIALNSGDKATSPGKAQVTAKDESLRRGETRQTLNPELFDHPTIKAAYQVAREIPWVLDSTYCYCYCEESPVFRHKSLLSCYVDNHAAG